MRRRSVDQVHRVLDHLLVERVDVGQLDSILEDHESVLRDGRDGLEHRLLGWSPRGPLLFRDTDGDRGAMVCQRVSWSSVDCTCS
jgi:hypothetical protein